MEMVASLTVTSRERPNLVPYVKHEISMGVRCFSEKLTFPTKNFVQSHFFCLENLVAQRRKIKRDFLLRYLLFEELISSNIIGMCLSK